MIFTGYFVLKYDKNGIFFNLKKYHKKKLLLILTFFPLNYVGTHVFMIVGAFGGHWMQKTFDFKLMLQILKLTFSPTPPSLNALLRSPSQAVTMTTSENFVSYNLRTH